MAGAPTTAIAPPSPDAASTALVRWLGELSRDDVAIAGGKGANLGAMAHAGLPVPPGFVVTVAAFRAFADATGLAADAAARLAALDPDDPTALRAVADTLQARVHAGTVPTPVRLAIADAYAALGARVAAAAAPSPPRVAVRSSGTAEDSALASFAGMYRTVLNVTGESALLEAVRACWASTFGARLLAYRARHGGAAPIDVAVVVQHQLQPASAGTTFSIDPTDPASGRLVVEATWGLGESVVGGDVVPDRFVVDRATRAIVARAITHKGTQVEVAAEGPGTIVRPVDASQADRPALDDATVRTVADLALRAEALLGAPQDVEWAVADGQVLLLQTRPITTLGPRSEPAFAPSVPAAGAVVVTGVGASPGVAVGAVRVLDTPAAGDALRAGEILVTRLTAPDWVPVMRRAAAIVTDAGGMTSHAAIVARELGLPCVVGTMHATARLRTGDRVVVDGQTGAVRRATAASAPAPAPESEGPRAPATAASARPAGVPATVTSATRLYVNLADPSQAEAVAARDVDGVGLVRAEFMLLEALDHTHPRQLLAEGRGEEFVDRLATALERLVAPFHPRPVIYRSTDFRSNEFRALRGGADHEPLEENPMLGDRGCARYARDPGLFMLELRALSRVRARFPGLQLMLPFVRTWRDFHRCRALVAASGLLDAPSFELWIMAEVPAVVSWLPEYVRAGVRGVSIGSNDLTQLVLGVDRDSAALADLFDERDRAVRDAIRRIVATCRRLGVPCSICGQAPTTWPEYADFLVGCGVDSISVNPDVVEVARHRLAVAEQRLLLAAARAGGAEARAAARRRARHRAR